MSREEEIRHCSIALKAADIIFDLAEPYKDKLFLEDHRDDDPNPCYHQTSQGLLLEFWGSRPVAIVTPWGKYCFAGWFVFSNTEAAERSIWEEILPQLKSRLGLILFKQKPEIEIDTIYGDLFAIGIEPGEFSLPFPEERGYSSFKSHDAACKEWRELVSQVRESV